MQRGEIWFAKTPGGDRPVLILTRDPVPDWIGYVVVAALTRTPRGLVSELELTPEADGVPTDGVVNFDNLHTFPRNSFRRPVTQLSRERLAESVASFETNRLLSTGRTRYSDCREAYRRGGFLDFSAVPSNRCLPHPSAGHPGVIEHMFATTGGRWDT